MSTNLTDADASIGGPPAYAIYLRIEGLCGEGGSAHHPDWIVASAYRQRLHKADATAGSFEIDKSLDRASPSLYRAVHTGRVFDRVLIEVCRDTGHAERFFEIEMTNSVIAEVRHTGRSGSGGARPVETIVFEYERIQWTYTKLREADGRPEGHSSSTWVPGESSER